jgi:hypothetical protein
MPPAEVLAGCPKAKNGDREVPHNSGSVIVGEKGKLFSPGDYGGDAANTGFVFGNEFKNQREYARGVEYVRSPGHFVEFANAIKGEGAAVSNFPDYSGPLSETILLGNLALLAGKKVEWDAAMMVAKDASPEVAELVRHQYQNGYSL